ncbi:MAG: metallophosphoesterase [Pikeienuella sp.]
MSTPDRIYAVGDIHGHLAKLKAVHDNIAVDLAAHPAASHAILHIGDYTDRGPDSRGVIEYLINGDTRRAPWINLYGNHDRMILRFLEERGGADPILRKDLYWLHPRLGGDTTLRSYGVDVPDDLDSDHGARMFDAARKAIPQSHVAFLRGLRLSYHWRDFFFVHAGVKPGIPLADQVEDDLIWIRGPFHESSADHGAIIVHGHTPVDAVEDHGNRIAIDTGAGYGNPITCTVFEADGGVRILNGKRLR